MKNRLIKRLTAIILLAVMMVTDISGAYFTGGIVEVQAQELSQVQAAQTTYGYTAAEYTTYIEKAKELETPLAIYNYLKNNINYEHYSGMRKGAEATFDSLGGNDVDQAVLLSEMLRVNGYETRFVTGNILLDAGQAVEFTGASDAHVAAEILGMSGYPVVKHLNSENEVTGIELEHTWVESYVPYSNYRGAGAATGNCMWIPLDTGIKKYQDNDTVYEFAAEQETKDSEELLALAMDNADSLYVTNKSIAKEELPYLPLSLQYEVVGEVTRSSEIDESSCDAITFTLSGAGSVTLKAYETYNKRITVVYEPVSTGIVRAALCLDGEVILTGDEVPEGYEETFTMHVKSGGRTSAVTNQVYAGGLYQVTVDMQNITAREISEVYEEFLAISATVTEENVCTDEYLGVLLDYVGKMYFAQVDIENNIMGEQMNLTRSRDLSVGMTGYRVMPVTMNGVLCGIEGGNLYIDIDHNVHRVESNTGDTEAVKKYLLASGMMSSALESSIWEQVTGAPSISTMSLIQEAIDMDTEIVMLTEANWQEEKDFLELSAETMEDIETRINSGKVVIVPVTEQTIGDWTGSGYMVLDKETYVGEYIISGGLNGGTTGAEVGFALLVNLIMAAIDMVETAALVPLVLQVFAAGGLLGTIGAGMLILLTTMMYIFVIEDVKTNVDLWYAYLEGDEAAGEQLIYNAGFNVIFTVSITAAFKGLNILADSALRNYAAEYITDLIGEEAAERFVKGVKSPGNVTKAVKALQKSGIGDDAIRKVVTECTEDELIRIGKLSKKGLQTKYVQELIDNPELLREYTDDEILGNPDILFGGSNTVNELKPRELLDELISSGVKCNLDEVVMVTKNWEGKLIWLEYGTSKAGLTHILEGHVNDFASKGISDIPQLLIDVLDTIPIKTGTNDRGRYAEYLFHGNTYRLAYGYNGFIVSFYPID